MLPHRCAIPVKMADISSPAPWGIRDIIAAIIAWLLISFGFAIVAEAAKYFNDDETLRSLLLLGLSGVLAGAAWITVRIANAPGRGVALCCIIGISAIFGAHLIAPSTSNGNASQAIINFTLFISSFIALGVSAWTFTRGKHNASSQMLKLLPPERPLWALMLAILIWAIALTATAAWNWMTASFANLEFLETPDNVKPLIDHMGGSWLLTVVLGCLAAPVAEEFFFRAFVLPVIQKRLGAIIAVLLSSAIFASTHISPDIGVGIIIPTFMLGAALAIIYLWTRSIWTCITIHSLHNALALSVAIVP